jgi:hypothetical protein
MDKFTTIHLKMPQPKCTKIHHPYEHTTTGMQKIATLHMKMQLPKCGKLQPSL